jgi:hypothetical protein
MTIAVTRTFDTQAEAEAFRGRYLANYPRAGYGTIIHVREVTGGKWSVTVERASSCD